MKKFIQNSMVVVASLALAGSVSAHVTVNPKEAVVGFSVATVRVPNEKDVDTIAVRVIVPSGVTVNGIMPLFGWTHTEKTEPVKQDAMKKSDTSMGDDDAPPTTRITEITWTGKVAAGEFMEFPLSVQYSADMDKVTWKAYQTYAGGEVIAWDGASDKEPAPSVTVLKEAKIDTLVKNQAPKNTVSGQTTWFSVGALLMSV